MNNTGITYEHQLINPKYLKADSSYQRDINFSKVNNIVKNFDINVFNEPKVSKRDDGFYYVFDGDHSIAAHKIVFGKETPIKCKVYYGLSREDEMRLFVTQNGISSNPTKREKLQALANYNDKKVTEMIDSAKSVGISVEFTASKGPNKILAVDAAYKVYETIGKEKFIYMLRVIKNAWNGSYESFQMGMLKGFGYIYKYCGDQIARLSTDDLAKPFLGYPVSKIVERARSLTGTVEKRFAIALIEQYNKKKRSGRIVLPEKS